MLQGIVDILLGILWVGVGIIPRYRFTGDRPVAVKALNIIATIAGGIYLITGILEVVTA